MIFRDVWPTFISFIRNDILLFLTSVLGNKTLPMFRQMHMGSWISTHHDMGFPTYRIWIYDDIWVCVYRYRITQYNTPQINRASLFLILPLLFYPFWVIKHCKHFGIWPSPRWAFFSWQADISWQKTQAPKRSSFLDAHSMTIGKTQVSKFY